MNKNILFVTTNYANSFDNCTQNSGVYLSEFAQPYLIFKATGYNIETASILGGESPIQESSMSCSNPMEWDDCIKILRNTKRLFDVDLEKFDAVYFPGGHGAMFDIAFDKQIKEVVEYYYNNKKIIAAVCHGVACLVSAVDEDNVPIVSSKKITSFTNKEERIGKLDSCLPFLLEDKLRELGAVFIEGKAWEEHVEIDGNIITGQNQNSAVLVAEKILECL